MKIKGIVSIFILLFVGNFVGKIQAAPTIISYGGQVSVDGQPFTGTGLFKFAILNAENNASLWSNDGTSLNGSQPSASVGIPVNGGLYSILLGNAAIQGMTGLDPNLFFQHNNTRLRIWFSDGEGFEQLSPDRRFASVPYALSTNIPLGSIGSELLSPAVRADLNRTITKSMLGSDVLNDLNRTITKSMLGLDVLGELNRTINSDELSVGVFAPRFSSSPLEISPPRFADDLNLADLNNDGALDIIDSSGLISLADGTGGFNEPFSIISAGNAGKTLAVADFDNDNYPDIFLGRWQNSHWVFFGDENCTYSRKIEIVPNIDPPDFMKASDSFILDAENDGDLDIILSHGHGVQGLLFTNPGDGNFTFSRPSGLDGVKNFVSGADFNGDGFTDIISAYFSNPKKNEGDGNFTNFDNTRLWEIGELNHNNGEIIVNDLNGNGENDIILFEGGGRGCTVFFNKDGNGTFELGSKFAVNLTNIQSFDLGDLDNDGDADILLLGDQGAYLFINDGAGNFFRGSHVIQTTSGSSVKLGDLDNDGDLDAVIGRGTHQSHQNLQVWWNDHAKGKVRFGQLEEKILNDLNRTITKSMLGSDVLNDLNRTITKEMLSITIRDELNASANQSPGATLENPFGVGGVPIISDGTTSYAVPADRVLVVTSAGGGVMHNSVTVMSSGAGPGLFPTDTSITAANGYGWSGLLFNPLDGIEILVSDGALNYTVPENKVLVITSAGGGVKFNSTTIKSHVGGPAIVPAGITVTSANGYGWTGYLKSQ